MLKDAVRVESQRVLSRFRNDFHACLTGRADALWCEPGPVRSPADLTWSPEYRRGYGAAYGGLIYGRIDTERLCEVPARLPLPRWPDGRIVLSVDVSPWHPQPQPPHPATTWAKPSNAAVPSPIYNDPEDKEQAKRASSILDRRESQKTRTRDGLIFRAAAHHFNGLSGSLLNPTPTHRRSESLDRTAKISRA